MGIVAFCALPICFLAIAGHVLFVSGFGWGGVSPGAARESQVNLVILACVVWLAFRTVCLPFVNERADDGKTRRAISPGLVATVATSICLWGMTHSWDVLALIAGTAVGASIAVLFRPRHTSSGGG